MRRLPQRDRQSDEALPGEDERRAHRRRRQSHSGRTQKLEKISRFQRACLDPEHVELDPPEGRPEELEAEVEVSRYHPAARDGRMMMNGLSRYCIISW